MEQFRISILNGEDCESFLVNDYETFIQKLRNDPRIAQKYKKMDRNAFIDWTHQGLTPKQFKKLQELNSF